MLGLDLSETIQFAFRRRYRLPPTDPRYLNATEEQMVLDYWAHRHWDDPKLREEVVNPDFEEDLEAFAAGEDEPDLPPPPADPGDWETVEEEGEPS